MADEYYVLEDLPGAFHRHCAHCGQKPRKGDRFVQVQRHKGSAESAILHDYCLDARRDNGLDWITGDDT